MTLDGEIADNNDNRRAKNQAGVYQDLLNYAISPELRQHVDARFVQFCQIDPSIKKEQRRYTKLGANERKRQETPAGPVQGLRPRPPWRLLVMELSNSGVTEYYVGVSAGRRIASC